MDYLSKEFYGNTVGEWGLSLLVIIGAFVVGRILYWFTTTVMRRLTAKTETTLDDLIVDLIEEPIVFAVTIAGIWFGLRRLELPEEAETWLARSMGFLIVISVTWLIARLLDALFREYLLPLAEKSETDLDDQLLPVVTKGTKLAVWSLGLIVALNNAGQDVGALLAGLGIGGFALAMAAKDTVANIFGGLTIFTDKPFVINDRVKIKGFDGVIKEIGVRSTRLETRAGRLVTIPNSTFADSPVENVSAEPSRRVDIDVGLTYDTTPEQMRSALRIVEEILEQNPDIADQRTISFNTFGDSAMNIYIRYFIRKGSHNWTTCSDVHLAILDRFTAAGLEMAFPTRTIYTRSLDTAGAGRDEKAPA